MSATLHRTEGSAEPVAWEVRNAEISYHAVFATEREARGVADQHDEEGYSQAVVRALFYATAPSGWQPIETAPKDGTYILVSNPAAGGSWVAQFKQFAASGFRFDEPWHSVMLNHWHLPDRHGGTPTVWQPLPLPPAPNQGEAS